MLRCTLALSSLLLLANSTFAGIGYEITSLQGEKTVTYMVNFGGGFMFEQYTAYDPISKAFVYLQWPRDGKAPQPVGKIWDHRTGETLDLYKFPAVNHPLPVIPSIKAMKVCPVTGSPKFEAKELIAFD